MGFTVTLVAGILVAARAIDHRPVDEYGFTVDREWWKSVAVGGTIAVVVNAGALGVSLYTGWASVSGFSETPGVLPFVAAVIITFALIAVAAIWEEFVFRGVMLKNFAEGGVGYFGRQPSVLLATLLSTLIFTASHGGKVTHVSQYSYYAIAGLLFGGVYVLTGDLSLPIGFHVFYNFSQGLFGLGVSQVTPELVVLDLVGPTRWVGEEGLVHILFAILGGLLLLTYIRWRDGSIQVHERVTRWSAGSE
jgi:membrane protease YdiL (CAAX protease family)